MSPTATSYLMPSPTVTGVDVEVYEVPTDVPAEADGTAEWSSTILVLARVHAAGSSGFGWTYASAACAPLVAGPLASVIIGRDALDTPAALEAMVRRCRNLGRPGLVSCAISAVETALWDLKARLLDVSLVALLGAAREEVPIYGSGGFTTYTDDQTRVQVRQWVQEWGIPRVKIKIGESWGARPDRDLQRIALVREVAGPDAELYVDANGGNTRKQAIRQALAMADQDVTWFEEPVSSDDLDGLREVRDAVSCDVAAGEYGYDLTYFRRMCAAGAVDCLQIDVTRCGGILEWQRAAAVAAAHGLQVSGHCAPNLHASVAASVPNLRHLEYFHDHVRVESLLFDGTLDTAGGALVPDRSRPGHGLTLRAEAARFRTG